MSAVLLPKRLPSIALRSLSRLASSKATPKHVPALVKEAVSPATTPVVGQAPNRALKWSTNQQSRPQAASLPRFEQTDMSLQPQPLSAMEMIAKEPVRLVHGRKAVCDGGGGPLGHPKIFINLDQPGPRSCGYCGLRFEQVHHHH